MTTASKTTRPLIEDSGSCDWGGCDNEAVAERYATDLAMWLPVCQGHLGPLPKGPSGRGVCSACGKDTTVSVKGLVRAHDRAFAQRCPGSGKAPTPHPGTT